MKGSIFKRKGGYAVVIEQPPGPDGKRRQKWLRGGRTRKEAEKKLLEALRARERGPLIEDQKQTVSAFLDRWLANTERKVRLRTLARYRSLCDTLKTHIGHCRLLQLTPAALEDCYTKLLVSGRVVRAHCACGHTAGRHAKGKDSLGQCIVKKCSCDSFRPLPAMQNSDSNGGLSARTVLHCHRVLSLALKQAVRLGQLSSNPCGSVDPPRAARKEMRTLDPIEANSVIEAAKGTRLEFFVVLALATGARRGELLGLKWSDLDLGAGTVSFSRTLQSDKTTGELKTARSKRTLRLPKIAIDAARKHRATRIQERLALGWAFEEGDFVFSWFDNRPWQADGIHTLWKSIVKKAGVGHCRIHDLRHTAASLMLARGVPITVVAETLGHSNTTTTLSTYAHAVKGSQEVAAQAMDSIFGTEATRS